LQKEYSVAPDRIIRRHGTLRDELLRDILDEGFFKKLKDRKVERPLELMQSAQPRWTGGFFDYYGPSFKARSATNAVKKSWRKEYLPTATEIIASAFCSAIAGYLSSGPSAVQDLRVTLHRVVTIGDEEVMQQACEYAGNSSPERMLNTAGRTFPPIHATIGLSYSTKKIVVSQSAANKEELATSMTQLNLNQASRSMSKNVQSLLAIPLLCPDSAETGGERVFCMLYADSFSKAWFSSDVIAVLVDMCKTFLREIERLSSRKIDRMSNYTYQAPTTSQGGELKNNLPGLLIYEDLSPPKAGISLALNFDHADFVLI